MTIRQSLERLTHRPSTSTWPHDPHYIEMQPAPLPCLSVNAWRTSADNDAARPAPTAENPFQPSIQSPFHDPAPPAPNPFLTPIQNPFQDPSIPRDEESIQHLSAVHAHHSHAGTHSPFRTDIEAPTLPSGVPKAPGTPSITALPLNLPYLAPREVHDQKFHRIFLACRLAIQILLFVLALIGNLLKYPKHITYIGMLSGNSLAFVLIWGAFLVSVYLMDGEGGMRMSRYSPEKEQWGKCVRMVIFDLMIVFVWLLVCWGNTAFAKGVMAEAAKKVGPGKNAGMGAPKFTPPVLAPKPTGR